MTVTYDEFVEIQTQFDHLHFRFERLERAFRALLDDLANNPHYAVERANSTWLGVDAAEMRQARINEEAEYEQEMYEQAAQDENNG